MSEPKGPRRRAKRGGGGFLLVLFVFLALGAGGYYAYKNMPEVMEEITSVTGVLPKEPKDVVSLYFADPKWTGFVVEKKDMGLESDRVVRIKKLMTLLIAGPTAGGQPILPKGAKLRGAYLGQNGLAVVDLEPNLDEMRSYGPGGEMISVYAIVQTICENVKDIKSVKITVGGREQETLAGHVMISEPLTPRPDLLGVKGR